MRSQPTRVLRAVFQSPPNPDRFNGKEWSRFVVVVLFPDEVKYQLATSTAAKRGLEIARKQINDRLYKPPDLDAMNATVEIVMVDLFRLGDIHRTLDDGTKVWLSEVARWLPPM